ncbi:MAG: rhomboid family intramembrane serine protease [Actinomycetota bacterium]|nr:rhomboid family intramembrane serine protease [Actinomycetota bacterium]
MATCYRHPSRETGVSCSNCDNPICTDCMTATPVGMRCPDCAKQKTKVRTAASIGGGDPMATYVLIGLSVLVAFGSGSVLGGNTGSPVFRDGALFGPAIDITNEYWRLITSGFLHAGLIHLAFNMYILYYLGSMLEPALGKVRFLALYFASMLGGSFGALLLSPLAQTVGASGAVFGLMGAAFVMQRARGMNPMQSGIGPLILLNVGISFVLPGISIGGHLGGLAAGALAALAIEEVAKRRLPRTLALVGCALVGLVAVAGALAVAGSQNAALGIG